MPAAESAARQTTSYGRTVAGPPSAAGHSFFSGALAGAIPRIALASDVASLSTTAEAALFAASPRFDFAAPI